MRVRNAVLVLVPLTLLLFVCVGGSYFAFCNLRFAPGAIPLDSLNRAIRSGLGFLDRSNHFSLPMQESPGHPPIEHWLTKQLLRYEPNPGLADDLERGWQYILNSEYRALARLPGKKWPPYTLRDAEWLRNYLFQSMRGHSTQWDYWPRWFIYAQYPGFISEFPDDFAELFKQSLPNRYGYVLTHRILVFRLFEELNPALARKYEISQARDRALRQLQLEMQLDFRLYDLYFERVAFFLEAGRNSPFIHRWIERILSVQKKDGGWHKFARPRCDMASVFGVSCSRDPSQTHPSFLALMALTRYREIYYR